MAAPVLQMAALAGARVEDRTQPVGSLRRRRRRNPDLAENAVAELERALFLEGDVGRGVRKGILVDPLARRSGAALHQLELLGFGEIGGRPGDGHDPREIGGRNIVARGGETGRAGGTRDGGAGNADERKQGYPHTAAAE